MACTWALWTAATTTSTSTACWDAWLNSAATSTTATTTTGVWIKWNTASAATTYFTPIEPVRRQLTAEEQARERQRQAEITERYRQAAEAQRLQQERERKEQAIADKRAEELLKRQLSGHQRRQYRRDRSFIVRGRDGHDYKIRRAWSGHVDRLDGRGRAVERFCIHPQTQVPLPDNQLIAKLMLETDPDEFKRIANRTQLVPAGG